MASGDSLVALIPQAYEAPGSSAATPDKRNYHPVIDLALTEVAVFTVFIPNNYGGGGVEVEILYAMSTAVANDIRLDTAFERIGEVQDLDTDSFDATGVNGTDTTVPGTSGVPDLVTNAHSDGARMDSLAAGEWGRLKITRTAVAGTDATGDLEIRGVHIAEQ